MSTTTSAATATATTAPATTVAALVISSITRTATGLYIKLNKASGKIENVNIILDTLPATVLVANAVDGAVQANFTLAQGAAFQQASFFVDSQPDNKAVQVIAQPVAVTALTPFQVLQADIAAAMNKFKQSTGTT